MKKALAIILFGVLMGVALCQAPIERLTPQAEPLSGEPCPSVPRSAVRDVRFGAGDAIDRGRADAIRFSRDYIGYRCSGVQDRVSCTATGPTFAEARSQETVALFEIPAGRSARLLLHRQVASCVLDPVAASTSPPAG